MILALSNETKQDRTPKDESPSGVRFIAPCRVRYIGRSPRSVLNDGYHAFMVFLCSVGLMVDRILRIGDTYFTYLYCYHLDRMSFFRTTFKAYLAADARRVDRWMNRQIWVDDMPDLDALEAMPAGSLGRSYFEAIEHLNQGGMPNLRPKRLKALPHEARALDREYLENIQDEDELFEALVSRRNIHMTSSHDFFHMLTGCNTRIAGEALVARYQYRHLLCPQNFMNMFNSMLCHFVIGRWRSFRTLGRIFEDIDRSRDFLDYDWEENWDKPLEQVRAELRIPIEGYMPGGVVPGESW